MWYVVDVTCDDHNPVGLSVTEFTDAEEVLQAIEKATVESKNIVFLQDTDGSEDEGEDGGDATNLLADAGENGMLLIGKI